MVISWVKKCGPTLFVIYDSDNHIPYITHLATVIFFITTSRRDLGMMVKKRYDRVTTFKNGQQKSGGEKVIRVLHIKFIYIVREKITGKNSWNSNLPTLQAWCNCENPDFLAQVPTDLDMAAKVESQGRQLAEQERRLQDLETWERMGKGWENRWKTWEKCWKS